MQLLFIWLGKISKGNYKQFSQMNYNVLYCYLGRVAQILLLYFSLNTYLLAQKSSKYMSFE